MVAGEELGPYRQLVGRKAQGFTRDRFRHAVQLKQDITRAHCRDPVFGLAFAFAHARFRRPRGDRFVGENANPEFAFALHVASERDAGGLNLRIGNPGAFQRLEAKFAKVDPKVARSHPLAASPLGLAILHAFGHQWHGDISFLEAR